MTFDWSEDVMVFRVFILFICLEPTVRKCIWMRKISVTVMVIFWKCHPEIIMFEVLSQQLWDTFATAFWRTTHNWRFYGHGSTYVLILSSRLEKKSWNENRRSYLESYKLHKNPSLHFEQHCTKIDHISLIFISFFSQANLVFNLT